MNKALEKEKIRELMRAKLRSQPEEERVHKNQVITNQILKMKVFQQAKTILFYYALPEEVSTKQLIEEAIQMGKSAALPYVDLKAGDLWPSIIENLKADLASGNYGMMEPKPEQRRAIALEKIDLVLVPGLAFDLKGHRLGRGKGYYDRFLKTLPERVMCYGLAFDFQLLESIPVDSWDESLDQVITNT